MFENQIGFFEEFVTGGFRPLWVGAELQGFIVILGGHRKDGKQQQKRHALWHIPRTLNVHPVKGVHAVVVAGVVRTIPPTLLQLFQKIGFVDHGEERVYMIEIKTDELVLNVFWGEIEVGDGGQLREGNLRGESEIANVCRVRPCRRVLLVTRVREVVSCRRSNKMSVDLW